ncbi:5086_t:CDS:1, partial [Cetraspora pellucida]
SENEKDDRKLSDEKLTNNELDKELNNKKLNNELSNIDDKNINLNKLNELEFVDIFNNDIEDIIYNKLNLEVNKFFEKKYSCHFTKQLCFEKLAMISFLNIKLNLKA